MMIIIIITTVVVVIIIMIMIIIIIKIIVVEGGRERKRGRNGAADLEHVLATTLSLSHPPARVPACLPNLSAPPACPPG